MQTEQVRLPVDGAAGGADSAAEAKRLGLREGRSITGVGQLPPTVAAALEPVSSPSIAEAWTRDLATSHYENFSVVSALLPRHLRQDFCNVYAFCRVADDLGDEVGDKSESVRLLADFRRQLEGMYAGQAATRVFVALMETVKRHDIPMKPFDDLIRAFEQDQVVDRYETFEQAVGYCTLSADPVGRIVLYMCGYRDEERQRLSDKTCTALQLINFWQDVRRDVLERDRVYLPAVDMQRFAVTVEQLRRGEVTQGYRDLVKLEVERTEALFAEGAALLPMLKPIYRKQIALFAKGGRAICKAVRRQGFDTLSKRPRLSKWQKGRLVAGTLLGYMVTKLTGGKA